MANAIGFPVGDTAIKDLVCEDNVEVLVFAKTLPNGSLKHAVVWHFSVEKLRDLFTKELPKPGFKHFRIKLMV